MDNKNTIIAIGVALLLLMLVFACSKGSSPKSSRTRTTTSQTSKTQKEPDYSKYDDSKQGHWSSKYSSSGSSSGSSSSYYSSDEGNTPPAILTKAEKEKMQERRNKQRKKLKAEALKWLQRKTNDVSLCDNTREKNKIKSHQGFANGTVAKRNHDYKTAIKCFSDTYKDEKATPLTKYFAATNLKDCAREMGDMDLYFIAARMEAKLIATEDLTMLNIDKSTLEFDWIDKVELALKAKKDPKNFEAFVKQKMDFYGGGINRKEAEQEAKEDIEYYSEMFKELVQ